MSGTASVLVVFGLFTVTGLGALAVTGVVRSGSELARRAALAPLAGMAWAGVAAATLGALGARLGVAGLVGLAAVTTAGGWARVRRARGGTREAPRPRASRVELAATAAGIVLIGLVTAFAALDGFRDKPLAEYDGWAMWGMKARALATLGSADHDLFASEAYARLHLEYPLLYPAINSLPLQLADGFTSNTVLQSSLAIGLAGLAGLWGILRDRVRPAILVPFLAALAAMPAFFLQLQTGYADIPLAVLVAAGVAAAGRWLLASDRSWLALATVFFAAAVLTKNEGLLFAAAAYVSLLVLATGRRRQVTVSALAVGLAYMPWRAYVAIHDLGAPDYDLSASFDLPWIADRLDRAPVAARELLELALAPRTFGGVLVLALAATAVSLLVGPRRVGALAAGFGLLSLAGLTWIYVLTPYELSFYLSTNGQRVVVAPLLALGALAPLLVEEVAREGSRREPDEPPVGGAR